MYYVMIDLETWRPSVSSKVIFDASKKLGTVDKLVGPFELLSDANKALAQINNLADGLDEDQATQLYAELAGYCPNCGKRNYCQSELHDLLAQRMGL